MVTSCNYCVLVGLVKMVELGHSFIHAQFICQYFGLILQLLCQSLTKLPNYKTKCIGMNLHSFFNELHVMQTIQILFLLNIIHQRLTNDEYFNTSSVISTSWFDTMYHFLFRGWGLACNQEHDWFHSKPCPYIMRQLKMGLFTRACSTYMDLNISFMRV